MNLYYSKNSLDKKNGGHGNDPRVRIILTTILVVVSLIIIKLFFLMIWQGGFYKALAAGSHEIFAQLYPKRGSVFIQDTRTEEKYPLAINRDFFLLFADTRLINNQEEINNIIEKLSEIFSYEQEKKDGIFLHAGCRQDYLEMAHGGYERQNSLFVALSANGKTSTTCKVLARKGREESWLIQDDGGTLTKEGSFKASIKT